MSNEEKILEILTSMQVDISGLKTDVTSLKTDVTSLKTDVTKLEANQRETNQRLEQLTVKVDNLSDKTERIEAHALHIDSKQADILGKLESLAAEDKRIVESMYKFDDADRERHLQMMKKIDVIKGVTRVNTLDIAELKAAINL